ncbi:hypothetical protein V7201_02185 [Bacillus sp. JJ1122]|uniref:hypothetical protein n=1 Tax=Bacillus sp. JJ1122 TaxID=3122951 RepID=UPI003000EEF7
MLVKQAELKLLPMAERKLEGLKKRRPEKVDYILQIERLWEEYAMNRSEFNLNRLLKQLEFTINRKAAYWGNRYKQIPTADFISRFYEVVWEVCMEYNHYQDFYLFETVCLVIERRGIDLTRKLKTEKGSFEKNILPLKEETADYIPDPRVNVESDVIDRDTVEQILNEDSLNTKERRLLQALYCNPELSYRDLAKVAGYNHHTEVTRSLDKIKMKINYIIL